jgi:hypothetical protein
LSAQQELLARALALRTKAAIKADALAVRSSTMLTRVVFLGLLLLPLLEPNSFYIVRAGRVGLPRETELHARSDVGPVARSVPPAVSAQSAEPPPGRATDDSKGPDLAEAHTPTPADPAHPAQVEQPADAQASTKPVPPDKQVAPPWTEAEIADAKQECDRLLAKTTIISEALPPAREGICGAPAPRELRSVGDGKVTFEPPATLNCPMIAGLNSWISDKLQPAAQKTFGSPIVRIVAESYSCRNRYGLARAPISEHAFMNAIDVSAFVLADGKVIRVSKGWGPTADELKHAQKSAVAPAGDTGNGKGKFLLAASKLGAHDLAKKSEEKPKSEEAQKEAAAKQATSAFLHEAHDDACDIFGTVLGPDTNDAHHDHFHLDMKARKQKRALCE